MILNENSIAEMKTGEGKTLVATLTGLSSTHSTGKGVHVVTVNDYLAQPRLRPPWAKLYGFLGLSTGVIVHGMSDDERRAKPTPAT